MDVQEELKLFKRYLDVFPGTSKAVLGVTSVYLAQQLETYISPNLDLGWIIQCILDINSENLFTNCRSYSNEQPQLNNSVHPEYNYATLIIKLCELFLKVSEGNTITIEEAKLYILNEDSEFYFGEQLSELNKQVLMLACPAISEIGGIEDEVKL